MMSDRYLTLTLFTLLTLNTACSESDNGPPAVPASTEAQKLALATDPGTALAVAKVKADGPTDDDSRRTDRYRPMLLATVVAFAHHPGLLPP